MKLNLIRSILVPPAGILLLVAILRWLGIYSLGPLFDPIAQLIIVAVGFRYFRRATNNYPLLSALVYFPMALALSWGVGFVVTGWLGWYDR